MTDKLEDTNKALEQANALTDQYRQQNAQDLAELIGKSIRTEATQILEQTHPSLNASTFDQEEQITTLQTEKLILETAYDTLKNEKGTLEQRYKFLNENTSSTNRSLQSELTTLSDQTTIAISSLNREKERNQTEIDRLHNQVREYSTTINELQNQLTMAHGGAVNIEGGGLDESFIQQLGEIITRDEIQNIPVFNGTKTLVSDWLRDAVRIDRNNQ